MALRKSVKQQKKAVRAVVEPFVVKQPVGLTFE